MEEPNVWENSSGTMPAVIPPSWPNPGFVSSQLRTCVSGSPILTITEPSSSPNYDQTLNLAQVFHGIVEQLEERNIGNESIQSSSPIESYDPKMAVTDNTPLQVEKMVGQLVPALDLVNSVNGLNLSQRQEAIKFAADSVLARSGSGTIWGHALSTELSASHATATILVTSKPDMDQKYLHMTTGTPTAFSDVAAACLQQGGSPSSSELPCTYDYDQNIPTSAPSFSTLPTESIESLDCLLSVTNSNADTMEDDDGISAPDITTEHKTGNMQQKSKMILSTTSITSQEPLSRTVSSAASSESADAQTRQEREESVSQGSSDPQQPNKESKGALEPAGFKTTSNKRLRDHHNSHHVDHDDEGNCTPGKPKPKPKTKTRTTKDKHAEKQSSYSSCHSLEFGQAHLCTEPDAEAIASMREMIYRAAAFRPINLGMEVLEKPKRKNVRISSDPQTVAARQRRERISHRIRILQRLVPGGTKMDTASMLDEAVNYLKFLKMQVKALESLGNKLDNMNSTMMQSPTWFASTHALGSSYFNAVNPHFYQNHI